MARNRKISLHQNVRQLFREFEQGRWFREARQYLNDKERMNNLLGLVSHLFRNRALAPVLKDLLLLYYYVKDIVSGRYRHYNALKLVMAVALLIYIVTPLDFIPDWLPAIGFLDDVALLGYVVKLLDGELDRYFHWTKGTSKCNK